MKTYVAGLRFLLVVSMLTALAAGCAEEAPHDMSLREGPSFACDPDNGGLHLPDGFCAFIVADTLGAARHLAVGEQGDVYVALRRPAEEGAIATLRDTDGDGRADSIRYFGDTGGTGIRLRGSYLYFAPDTMILRYPMTPGALLPSGPPETVVYGFPRERQHAVKPFEFDDEGWMYVNVGAPSNACQDPPRTAGVAGQDPCPLLETYGGVWRFRADELDQTQADHGYRYASGIRNGVANAWNPITGRLYVAQHGRDQLSQLWPDLYTNEQSAELPSEELFEVTDGSNFGWPYCYYDHLQGKKVLSPEYGGDGQEEGRCEQFDDPIVAFPGHWAPNDVLFYTGTHFPEHYRGGAFIAFHGSWNRAPLPQEGYKVVFVPFVEGEATGAYEVFADGFTRVDTVASSRDAVYRPMGLAEGADGSLYIVDSRRGRLWRVIYTGLGERG
ncbi:MAG: PQQ-dependent sugar dehydrogenase [Rhodothermales bacterium]